MHTFSSLEQISSQVLKIHPLVSQVSPAWEPVVWMTLSLSFATFCRSSCLFAFYLASRAHEGYIVMNRRQLYWCKLKHFHPFNFRSQRWGTFDIFCVSSCFIVIFRVPSCQFFMESHRFSNNTYVLLLVLTITQNLTKHVKISTFQHFVNYICLIYNANVAVKR